VHQKSNTLGHVITCTLSDDKDLQREMYIRTNTLPRNLVSVPRKSRSGYLGHIVYVCMVLHCGILIQFNA